MKNLFLYSLMVFCIPQLSFADEAAPQETAPAPSQILPGYFSFTQESCAAQMEDNHCNEYFLVNPEARKKARKCNEDWPSTLKSLPRAAGVGTVEVVKGASDAAVGLVICPYTLTKSAYENISQKNRIVSDCDKSIECLRGLAFQAAFITKDGKLRSDEEIKDYGAQNLMKKRIQVNDMAMKDKSYRDWLKKIEIPYETEEFLRPLIDQTLSEFNVKIACYNPQARAELAGYALGYILGTVYTAKAIASVAEVAMLAKPATSLMPKSLPPKVWKVPKRGPKVDVYWSSIMEKGKASQYPRQYYTGTIKEALPRNMSAPVKRVFMARPNSFHIVNYDFAPDTMFARFRYYPKARLQNPILQAEDLGDAANLKVTPNTVSIDILNNGTSISNDLFFMLEKHLSDFPYLKKASGAFEFPTSELPRFMKDFEALGNHVI